MTERHPTEMNQDELLDQMLRISEHRAQAYLTDERKQQLTLQMNRMLFEYQYREGVYDDGTDAA